MEVIVAGNSSTAILKEEERLKDNTVALLFAGSDQPTILDKFSNTDGIQLNWLEVSHSLGLRIKTTRGGSVS